MQRTHSTFVILWAAMAVGPSCDHGPLATRSPDAGGEYATSVMDAASHDVPGSADDVAPAPVADGAPGGEDVPPDAATPDPEAPNREALAELRASRDDRWRECFGASRALLAELGDDGPLPPGSLRAGRVSVDRAAAAACVRRLRAATCAELAETIEEDGRLDCPGLYVGHVALGEPCENDHECPGVERFTCVAIAPSGACALNRCARRTPLGGICAALDCELGLGCNGDMPPRCVRPVPAALGEGDRCDGDLGACKPGLQCVLEDFVETPELERYVCRARRAGAPCRGSWQCLEPHACVLPDAGGTGACAAGRREGERCRPQVAVGPGEGGAFSDCAWGLACVDRGQGFRVCSAGLALGESCALGSDGPPRCLGGYCGRGRDGGAGVCLPPKRPGEDCTDHGECPRDQLCSGAPGLPATCQPSLSRGISLGSRCWLDRNEGVLCVAGAFCARVPGAASEEVGVCMRDRGQGEACGEGIPCGAGLACVGGACRACTR